MFCETVLFWQTQAQKPFHNLALSTPTRSTQLLLLLFFITPTQAAHRYNEHKQLKYKTINYNIKIYFKKHQSEVKKTGLTQ